MKIPSCVLSRLITEIFLGPAIEHMIENFKYAIKLSFSYLAYDFTVLDYAFIIAD